MQKLLGTPGEHTGEHLKRFPYVYPSFSCSELEVWCCACVAAVQHFKADSRGTCHWHGSKAKIKLITPYAEIKAKVNRSSKRRWPRAFFHLTSEILSLLRSVKATLTGTTCRTFGERGCEGSHNAVALQGVAGRVRLLHPLLQTPSAFLPLTAFSNAVNCATTAVPPACLIVLMVISVKSVQLASQRAREKKR